MRSVDFLVQAGTLVTLLGPSGCGKTTTLRLIAGHEQLTDGDIVIGDQTVNDMRVAEDGRVWVVFYNGSDDGVKRSFASATYGVLYRA